MAEKKSSTAVSRGITEFQAFKAMVKFLELYYERTNSDDVGSLLGDLQVLSDGMTADPAAWNDWIRAIQASLQEKDIDIINN